MGLEKPAWDQYATYMQIHYTCIQNYFLRDGWFIDLIPLKPEVCPKSVLEVLPLSQKVCFFPSLLRFFGHPSLCHLKGSFCVVTALSLLGLTSNTVWMGMWGEQSVQTGNQLVQWEEAPVLWSVLIHIYKFVCDWLGGQSTPRRSWN